MSLDYPLWLRATHFFNFLLLSLLVRSGFRRSRSVISPGETLATVSRCGSVIGRYFPSDSNVRFASRFPLRFVCTGRAMGGAPVKDTPSAGTALGIDFVDVPIPADQRSPVRFTFFWTNNNSWVGRDYVVEVES